MAITSQVLFHFNPGTMSIVIIIKAETNQFMPFGFQAAISKNR
jgi:hypothetical protein